MNAIPRQRIDALTDGVFAIAMTILVLEIRLPPHATYANAAELLAGLGTLGQEFIPYPISFFVLALFWRGAASMRVSEGGASRAHVTWWLFYLFLMTCIPIATSICGNQGHLAPAIWLYAANMLLGAAAGWGMTLTAASLSPEERAQSHIQFAALALSALASIAWSFFDPSTAMLAYLGNALAPAGQSLWQRRHAAQNASARE